MSDLGNGNWKGPFPGQQTKFWSASEDVVFGGGAGGGGKSVLLKMAYIHQLVFEHERYRTGRIKKSKAWAIYFRRKTPDLTQAIDESHEYFPQIDPKAKFDAKDGHNIWTFPSCGGAKFQFAHMQHETDRFKYKSSAYCTAAGTPVLMADGSWRPIEAVQNGELVHTLEGPRPVVAVWDSGTKTCVKAVVRDASGRLVGEQVHPVGHPVLTSEGVLPLPSAYSNQISSRPLPGVRVWRSYESLLGARRESTDVCVGSGDTETGFGVFGDERQGSGQPGRSILLRDVVLYEPIARLGPRAAGDALSRESLSYEPGDFLAGYRPLHGSCGERLRCEEDAVPVASPQQADVGTRSPVVRTGAQAPSPSHIRRASYKYIHPYTGQAREGWAEIDRNGTCELTPCGERKVYDLTVLGANHYITASGLVNKQTYLAFDELTEFEEIQFLYMQSRLRCSDEELVPYLQCRAASNPDGPGLLWVRNRFIEDRIPERVYRTRYHLDNGMVKSKDEVFIPFRLKDNPVLYKTGAYEMQLRGLPPDIREAILEGNWYFASGAFLARVWVTKYHVIEDHAVPAGVAIYRSADYGYNKQSSVTWWYKDRDGILTAFYNIYVLNKTPEQLADLIKEVEQEFGLWDDDKDMSSISGPLDSACWNKQSSQVTIAARLASCGVRFYKARKGPGSRKNGAIEIISRLEARLPSPDAPDDRSKDRPMVRYMKRCAAPIRTLPVLRSDPHNPEDVDTDGEDHCYDDLMYMCLANPMGPREERDPDEDEVDNVVDMPKRNRMW